MKTRLKTSIFAVLLFSSIVCCFVPFRGEAAVAPVRIVQIAACLAPQNSEASVIGTLCSHVISFMDDEAAKTDADLKACKDKCGWKKRKDDLINAARKKAKESCSKGEAPDVNELSKGLDRNTKDRLKGLYDRNSRMFDGKAKLEAANFGAVSSKDTAITGKGGKITDLKSYEPATPKLNSATEFSLAGTKLSGKTGTPDGTKQAGLSAADTPDASLKVALLPQKVQAATGNDLPKLPICGAGSALCPGNAPCQEDKRCASATIGEPGWSMNCIDGKWCIPPGPVSDCGPYDTKKSCCINKKVVDKFKTPDKTLQSIGTIPNCKSRIQVVSEKVVKPEKKGCSITPAAARFINIKERRFANPGKVIKFLHLDSGRPLITDFNDPFKGLTPPFSGPCNTHDWCYGTCRKNAKDAADRKACDDKLLKNLKENVCPNAKYPVTRDECNELADDINKGLSWPIPVIGGPAAFAAAQIEHCKCDLCP